MLRDISTVEVQGGLFASLTPFSLFEPKDGNDYKTVKGALLYGRNGSGKSTIARAFRKARGEEQPAIMQVSFVDKDGKSVTLSDDEKKKIFVFDEDFVNEKVKLKEDHLDTIIMLGEAADLAGKIEQAEKDRDSARTVYEMKEVALKEYMDDNNSKSPANYLSKIGKVLRGDDAWAGRNRRICGARQNTQVKEDTYKKFIDLTPPKTRSDLIVEFNEQMRVLETAKSGSSKINSKVPTLPESYNQYDDETIIDLLAKKIEKPELSEREQYLMGLVEAGKTNELSRQAAFFRNPDVKECPYCFQLVDDEYKTNLVASIEKVLSKTVEEHQKSLQGWIYNDVSIDISQFSSLPSYETCCGIIDKINTAIQTYNKLIQQKIEKPYLSIMASNQGIAKLMEQLSENLAILESEKEEYNKKATNTAPIINKLNEINSHIAHYDINDLVAGYNKQQKEFKIAEKEFNDAKSDYDTKSKAVEDLDAQRKSVQLALDIMNACLKYIFFAEDRLRIDYTDGEYRLYSHGKRVRPCDVSVGERNIIGLSYFFTSIMEGQEKKDVYGKEYLLIIDDPVSSFDTENRIGIFSFLKYMLGMFLEGNEFSKAFVMTHDLMTFYDIYKLFEEIINCCKKKNYTHKPKFNRFEIVDGAIKLFEYKNRQEYTEILELIYEFGQGNSAEHDLIIGNLMRQALEAFATFQYKKGIEDVSTDPDILDLLPESAYRSYYENLMYRLLLHGGSHREEQIKAMKDYDFFSLISEAEKKRTAKEVLCFIYLLNKKHVLQHLHEIKDVETTLEAWCSQVKARAAMP